MGQPSFSQGLAFTRMDCAFVLNAHDAGAAEVIVVYLIIQNNPLIIPLSSYGRHPNRFRCDVGACSPIAIRSQFFVYRSSSLAEMMALVMIG